MGESIIMEVTKRILLHELRERLESRAIPSVTAEDTLEVLYSILQEHVRNGDSINIRELSVQPAMENRNSSQDISVHSHHRRRRSKSNRDSRYYSSNYFLNELILIFHGDGYTMRKAGYFIRNAFFVSLFLAVYYFLITLVGC